MKNTKMPLKYADIKVLVRPKCTYNMKIQRLQCNVYMYYHQSKKVIACKDCQIESKHTKV